MRLRYWFALGVLIATVISLVEGVELRNDIYINARMVRDLDYYNCRSYAVGLTMAYQQVGYQARVVPGYWMMKESEMKHYHCWTGVTIGNTEVWMEPHYWALPVKEVEKRFRVTYYEDQGVVC